jgi:hypothetical protein
MKRRDPVTPIVALRVMVRDGGCVAALLDLEHQCTGQFGNPVHRDSIGAMTLDHVKDQPRMGVRAPSDVEHLVTLCWGAHLLTGWATSHRPELRAYLKEVNGAE